MDGCSASRAHRWGGLQLRWANALWRLGRRDSAREKLAAAATMDLGPSQQALLARMQGKAKQR